MYSPEVKGSNLAKPAGRCGNRPIHNQSSSPCPSDRELLDQPPHFGLLFAGTHELEEIFTRQALELEQWRSRFHAGQALPGISEEEAAEIVHSDLGLGLSQRKIQKLIAKSRITDLRNGSQHSYVSARRLFWVIRELQAVRPRRINTRLYRARLVTKL